LPRPDTANLRRRAAPVRIHQDPPRMLAAHDFGGRSRGLG
jgi:hypothetical protein